MSCARAGAVVLWGQEAAAEVMGHRQSRTLQTRIHLPAKQLENPGPEVVSRVLQEARVLPIRMAEHTRTDRVTTGGARTCPVEDLGISQLAIKRCLPVRPWA